jgi:hypothetical protein
VLDGIVDQIAEDLTDSHPVTSDRREVPSGYGDLPLGDLEAKGSEHLSHQLSGVDCLRHGGAAFDA